MGGAESLERRGAGKNKETKKLQLVEDTLFARVEPRITLELKQQTKGAWKVPAANHRVVLVWAVG